MARLALVPDKFALVDFLLAGIAFFHFFEKKALLLIIVCMISLRLADSVRMNVISVDAEPAGTAETCLAFLAYPSGRVCLGQSHKAARPIVIQASLEIVTGAVLTLLGIFM